ncbi:MAG: hypothetical protein AAFR33_01630 [Pseudomonadota bacterium]
MEDGFISYHTRPDGERYFTNADMAAFTSELSPASFPDVAIRISDLIAR